VSVQTTCNFCNSESSTLYIKTDLVSYHKCSSCGLVFQHPVLTQGEINDIYDANYFEYEHQNHENFFKLMLLSLKDINFDELQKTLPSKRFLDIGCATGLLLNHVRENMGFETSGVEICKDSVSYAIEKYNLDIHSKPLIDVSFPSNHFGVVHFSHLIEHVPNPSDILKEVYRILMPGGYAIITTPNLDGIFAKHYKGNWRAVMPQHLWLFSKTVLSRYLSNIGFKVIKDLSWGSIPAEKNPPKIFKFLSDKFVKSINRGDVMLLLCYKE